MKNIYKRHFVLDVESDGPNIFRHNMISFGLVSLYNPEVSFFGQVAPLHENGGGIKAARDISGVSFEEQKKFKAPPLVMKQADEFLRTHSEGKRVCIWSDNPAYDWLWFNTYMHEFVGDNICGFSARRIGDFSAGLKKKPLETQGWKKHRKTSHTHNPVDDAKGNAQALRVLLQSCIV